ncbi:MAG: GxxExxY protein [Planctomycetota bacterium]
MKWDDSEYREINDKVINCFYKVYDKIGPGLLEEAYHKALIIELKKHFKSIESEKSFPVIYDNQQVSTYIPDILVENKVIIEVKSVKALDDNHRAQIISQLRVSGVLIGFLVNFASKELEFKRYDNFYALERQGLNLE